MTVQFTMDAWDGLRSGAITVTFRTWKRPMARRGGTHITPAGVLAVDDVRIVRVGDITEADARRAGFADRVALLTHLGVGEDDEVYLVEFHHAGEDPRIALRREIPTDAEADALIARLERLDRASAAGPWTRRVMELIAANPGRRAPDLAAEIGWETAPFKVNVRKLKALGLTESLKVGYRVSPRGEAVMDRRIRP